MATPAQYPFTGDGSRTVFPIPTKILGQEYIRVHIDSTPILDQTLYDIINNSIVFKTAPASASTLIVWVATDAEEIAELGTATNIDVVANNIDDIIVVANGINDITTVSSDAQLKAWESEAEAMTSASYATQVEDTVVYEYGSNGDGTFNAVATTDYSAYHWSQKASTFNPALYVLQTDLDTTLGSLISEGTYTPILTGSSNVDGITATATYYQRVGDIVTVHGLIYINPTTVSTLTSIDIDLPIASTVTYTTSDLSGSAFSDVNSDTYVIKPNISNDGARFQCSSCSVVGNNGYWFTFRYKVK